MDDERESVMMSAEEQKENDLQVRYQFIYQFNLDFSGVLALHCWHADQPWQAAARTHPFNAEDVRHAGTQHP